MPFDGATGKAVLPKISKKAKMVEIILVASDQISSIVFSESSLFSILCFFCDQSGKDPLVAPSRSMNIKNESFSSQNQMNRLYSI